MSISHTIKPADGDCLREDAEQERRSGREAIPHCEQEHTALEWYYNYNHNTTKAIAHIQIAHMQIYKYLKIMVFTDVPRVEFHLINY